MNNGYDMQCISRSMPPLLQLQGNQAQIITGTGSRPETAPLEPPAVKLSRKRWGGRICLDSIREPCKAVLNFAREGQSTLDRLQSQRKAWAITQLDLSELSRFKKARLRSLKFKSQYKRHKLRSSFRYSLNISLTTTYIIDFPDIARSALATQMQR